MSSNSIILPKKHISLISTADIDEILTPLKRLGILYFSYMRNHPDRSQVYLSNDGNWVEAYYKHRLYESSQFQKSPENYSTGKVIWPCNSDLPVYQFGREYLKSDNGLTIIKRSEKYTEFYFLSGSVDNTNINNIYINNFDLLEKFILYFNDRAEKIINKATESKIILPSYLYNEDSNTLEGGHIPADIAKTIIEEMRVKKYRVKHNNYFNIKLSSRELDCIFLYMNGKTAKETAKELNISQRTVETYFENVKNKLDCYTKDDVIRFLIKDGLAQ